MIVPYLLALETIRNLGTYENFNSLPSKLYPDNVRLCLGDPEERDLSHLEMPLGELAPATKDARKSKVGWAEVGRRQDDGWATEAPELVAATTDAALSNSSSLRPTVYCVRCTSVAEDVRPAYP
jgi:hypothetical protein